jgi:GNAT superfamily N-acetyltransferase
MALGDVATVRDRVGAGLRAAWLRHARTSGAGVVERFDGILGTLTGLPDDTLNTAFVEHEPTDPPAAVHRVDAWFSSHGQHLGLDLERGRHPAVERAVEAAGLRMIGSRPAMAVALPRPAAGPGAVEVVRVGDGRDLDRLRSVQSRVFGLDPTVAGRFLSEELLADPGYRAFLAVVDGEAVGSSSIHLDGGSAGVFGVATVPGARRRGVGAALTGRCLAEAAEAGADLAWLQSTPDGLSVYERLGFSVVADWDVWTR